MVRNGVDKPTAQIQSVTCSKVDPDWAMVKYEAAYQNRASDMRGGLAFVHREGDVWTFKSGGFHGGAWCVAANDSSFPSDLKSDSGCS